MFYFPDGTTYYHADVLVHYPPSLLLLGVLGDSIFFPVFHLWNKHSVHMSLHTLSITAYGTRPRWRMAGSDGEPIFVTFLKN